jgi:hypothetical protein
MVQVESEEIRLALLAHLAERAVIIHECGDELSMAKMILVMALREDRAVT